jgi:D-glycero-D-manno-heptose 1,7-bisphosphate phosphatase
MRVPPRRAAFLDRDGTIIVDRHYPADPTAVELLPRAAEAIRLFNEAGLVVVVVTNQSGIGRGYFDEAAFRAVQARMESLLAAEGARVDAVYHCPHAPGLGPPCECRKPAPGLYLRAARELGLALRGSVLVGDRERDVAAARELGAAAYLITPTPDRPRNGAAVAAVGVRDLREAACHVLGRHGEIDDAPARL